MSEVEVNELVERIAELVVKKLAGKGAPKVEPGWFSIKTAAEFTGLKDGKIREAVVSKSLPAANISSGARPTYRIKRADLDEWMEARKREAIPVQRRKAGQLPDSPHYPRAA